MATAPESAEEDTGADEAAQSQTWSMANTKPELVQAAVDEGYDESEVSAVTKPEILELLGA
jgi:hypothetical protein